ncbi:MAG: hypothetical protein M1350_03320 [Actinobacteria bacterium]|nr:hypothetical protein [Actinomycetota bacterium]
MAGVKELKEEVAGIAKNAAYVAVGLGVMGVQRAQVKRNELAKRLGSPSQNLTDTLSIARHDLTARAKAADSKLEAVLDRIDTSLEPLEEKLPSEARAALKYAQHQARTTKRQIAEKLLSSTS